MSQSDKDPTNDWSFHVAAKLTGTTIPRLGESTMSGAHNFGVAGPAPDHVFSTLGGTAGDFVDASKTATVKPTDLGPERDAQSEFPAPRKSRPASEP